MREFYLTSEKFHSGASLNEYQNTYSIIECVQMESGETRMKIVFPKTKEGKASEKHIPMKVTLGNLEQAKAILRGMLRELGEEIPHEPMGESDGFTPPGSGTDEDCPF